MTSRLLIYAKTNINSLDVSVKTYIMLKV